MDQRHEVSAVPRTLSGRRAAPDALPHHPTSYQRRQQNRSSLEGAKDPSISTASPFQSPISPNFAPTIGLAPRPPSYRHDGETELDELIRSGSQRRRDPRGSQRASRDSRDISETIPARLDAPRAAPSASRGGPGSDDFSSTPLPTRTKSSSTQSPQDRDAGQRNQRSVAVAPGPSHRVRVEDQDTRARVDTSGTVPPQRTVSGRQNSATDYPPTSEPSGRQQLQPLNVSTQQRREWAPDRSPLQKLELTLQDITKEEKRAQVEEAELLLREAKAGRGQRQSSRGIRAPSAGERREVSGGVPAHLAEAGLIRNLSNRQRDRIQSTTTVESRKPSDSRGTSGGGAVGRDFEYQEQEYQQPVRAPAAGTGVRRAVSGGARTGSGARQSAPEPSAPSASLGRSSHRRPVPDYNHPEAMGAQPSREIPQAQKQLYAERLARPQTGSNGIDPPVVQANESDDDVSDLGPEPGVAPKASERANVEFQPPQRAHTGGLREHLHLGSKPASNGHHISNLLPHRLRDSVHGHPDPGPTSTEPRPLEEWKRAATARISVKEAAEPERRKSWAGPVRDKAWWERNGRATRGGPGNSSMRPEPETDEATDSPVERNNGMDLLEVLQSEDTVAEYLPDIKRRSNPALPRSRQDLSHGDDLRERLRLRRRNRSLDRDHEFANIRTDNTQSLLTISTTPYSYSCPRMHEHDVFHPFHVCPPTLDKKLTRSMRSIRVRSAAEPITFQPPLFLKCGPLLRYLGIRHDRPPSSGRVEGDVSADREIWRGSVMIVTTDAESSYETPPTLRLFLQPMTLRPPPPAQVNGESGDLPPEYVDPIAGLPVLSRTGHTMYVKPVDHLEEERDLSRLETDEGLFSEVRTPLDPSGNAATDGPGDHAEDASNNRRISAMDGEKKGKYQEVKGIRLHTERGLTFWRFSIEVELGERQCRVAYRINRGPAVGFWVPARNETMNVMFHSCNGFSLSVNPDQFSGPDPLWRDVLNTHQTRPFHVMIGGGDQIYNDAVVKQTTAFQEWLCLKNPLHKHSARFTPEMLNELETFYLERYAMWFSQGLFGVANSQIPMVNMWDDHDIIDGFGSYPDHFMRTPVFSGLGNVAFKYYMLFQHQSVPQELERDEPSWILGRTPGPYIHQFSRSVFMSLGQKVAFLGLDCRTERTREEVVMGKTYDAVFERCKREIIRGETKHLIVLLGIPIAYPRLVWLENILTSRIMDPVKAIGKSGMLGGFLNQFDGGVEILDDLDDHWTSRNHKHERNWFVEELQHLAADKLVRVTILGGDVHLAAIGQFYSNPKLGIPKDRDHRYMPNIISSAIVNTPPPEMLADVLNKRNKVHHLDHYTDEDMIPMFTHDVDGTARNNKRLLPRRNWCSIREYHPGATPPGSPTPEPSTGTASMQSVGPRPGILPRTFSLPRRDSMASNSRPANLLRRLSTRVTGNRGMSYSTTPSTEDVSTPNQRPFSAKTADGSYFPSQPQRSNTNGSSVNAPPQRPTPFHRQTTGFIEGKKRSDHHGHVDLEAGLDIVLNMEVSQKDPAGITMPYRLLVPALHYDDPVSEHSSDTTSEHEAPKQRPTGLSMVRRLSQMIPGGKGGRGGKGYYADEAPPGRTEFDGAYDEDEKADSPSPPRAEPKRQPNLGDRISRRLSLRRPVTTRRTYDDNDETEYPSPPAAEPPSQPVVGRTIATRRPFTTTEPSKPRPQSQLEADAFDDDYGTDDDDEEDDDGVSPEEEPKEHKLFGELTKNEQGRWVAGRQSPAWVPKPPKQVGMGRDVVSGGGAGAGKRAKW